MSVSLFLRYRSIHTTQRPINRPLLSLRYCETECTAPRHDSARFAPSSHFPGGWRSSTDPAASLPPAGQPLATGRGLSEEDRRRATVEAMFDAAEARVREKEEKKARGRYAVRSSVAMQGIAKNSVEEFQNRINRFDQRYVDDWNTWIAVQPNHRAAQFGAVLRNWQACRPNTPTHTSRTAAQ